MARKKKTPERKCPGPQLVVRHVERPKRRKHHPKRSQNLYGRGPSFERKRQVPYYRPTRKRTLGESKSKKRYKFTNPANLVQPPMGLAFGMQPPQNLFVGSAQYPIVL